MAFEDMIVISRGERRFRVRVAATIIHKGRVLLQSFAEHDGFWVLPGGNAEVMEPTVDGVMREMKEELGEGVHVERLLWVRGQLLPIWERGLARDRPLLAGFPA